MEVRSGSRAAVVEVRVACDDPKRGAVETEVEQRMPDREEAAQRTVLQIDVVPAIEEESDDQQRREQAGDQILAPDRLRAHPGSSFVAPPRGRQPTPPAAAHRVIAMTQIA